MTIPSRPAPPPPNASRNSYATASISRYTPTTNWDDSPFESTINQQQQLQRQQHIHAKKNPPPRPPPPKINTKSLPALKKVGQPQSVNILSNLFGSSTRRARTPPNKLQPPPGKQNFALKLPPKIPAPPNTLNNHHGQSSSAMTDLQLIDFNSPASSPTLTQKSNSDCVSVDSFSSDSNYSPNNGNSSQAESGFEDDFGLQDTNKDLWETASDPFAAPPVKTENFNPKVRPVILQKPIMNGISSSSSSSSLFYTSKTDVIKSRYATTPQQQFDDPLCNGKSLIAPQPSLNKPTIIKPIIASKPQYRSGKSSPPTRCNYIQSNSISLDDESLPSLPMPSCPPPPPPAEYFINDDQMNLDVTYPNIQDDYEPSGENYGIALYDFDSDQDGDLNFRENEKVYILKQLDHEWMYGRNKRGCEGMFPINYIEIKKPLIGQQLDKKHESIMNNPKISEKLRKAKALYDFTAETNDDLTIKEGDIITILHEINHEWLFGQLNNKTGQLPANFIEFIP